MSAAIRLEALTKRFGSVTAVDALDLDIEAGSFFALLGPSGCGKTTTLRMIGGFEEPTSGRILLGGDDVTDVPPFRRDVNTVFQSYALFPHLDVAKNVAFGLERRGVERAEITRRVGEVLELTQLGGFEQRKPGQLSGGQQQRVALARALVNRPRALLLDEPLGALDLRLRRQLQIELKRIQQEVGITFVHVTHDQEEAMTMADIIAVMNDGRVEQLGGAEDLYERPRTAFVANFLGTSNLLSPSTFAPPDGAADGARAGVRPEKIMLLDAGETPPSGAHVLRGQVAVASFLGVSLQYVVSVGDGEEVTVFVPNRGAATHGPGSDVQLVWRPEDTFVVA
jgi:spermidine/putrescine transport system ATP-binding protein